MALKAMIAEETPVDLRKFCTRLFALDKGRQWKSEDVKRQQREANVAGSARQRHEQERGEGRVDVGMGSRDR